MSIVSWSRLKFIFTVARTAASVTFPAWLKQVTLTHSRKANRSFRKYANLFESFEKKFWKEENKEWPQIDGLKQTADVAVVVVVEDNDE